MRAWLGSILVYLVIGLSAAQAAEAGNGAVPSVNLGVEYFLWSEEISSQRVLRETGPRLTFGIAVDNLMDRNLVSTFAAEIRGYTGDIDYDGRTQSGIPVESDVDYSGISGEFMLANRMAHGSNTSAQLALGFDAWSREIKDTTLADGSPVYGYQEDYLIVYAKLGPGFYLGNGASRSLLQLGIKYPLYTNEKVNLSTVGFDSDVELEPGKRVSLYAKWRKVWSGESGRSRFGASIYYDSFVFGASDWKPITAGGTPYLVSQPDSRMYVLGGRLEFYF